MQSIPVHVYMYFEKVSPFPWLAWRCMVATCMIAWVEGFVKPSAGMVDSAHDLLVHM